MALITEPIPPQAFELIRDRLAEIFIEELNNQVINNYDPSLEAEVFVERALAVDKTEDPIVIISFAGGPVDSKNPTSSTGGYMYNIDVFTNAKSNDSQEGDVRSALKAQRIIGALRLIIQSPKYNTLGFAKGEIVARVSIKQIAIWDPGVMKQDATNSYMGRISILVEGKEVESTTPPRDLEGYTTVIKISDGNRGYRWENI